MNSVSFLKVMPVLLGLLLSAVSLSARSLPWSEDFADSKTLTEAWALEGTGTATVVDGTLQLQESPDGVGVVLWTKDTWPASFHLSFDVSFSNSRGIGVFFFAAQSSDHRDAWRSPAIRTGAYDEYIRGDLDSYSLSLHRYWPDGRNNPGSNLRRNSGFHLLSQALPDPCLEAGRDYRLEIIKEDNHLRVRVDGQLIHETHDDGSHGSAHGEGRIGFRLRGDASCIMTIDRVRLTAIDHRH